MENLSQIRERWTVPAVTSSLSDNFKLSQLTHQVCLALLCSQLTLMLIWLVVRVAVTAVITAGKVELSPQSAPFLADTLIQVVLRPYYGR